MGGGGGGDIYTYLFIHISAYLDLYIKPIAAKVKSYIKDTNDFRRKLQNFPIL